MYLFCETFVKNEDIKTADEVLLIVSSSSIDLLVKIVAYSRGKQEQCFVRVLFFLRVCRRTDDQSKVETSFVYDNEKQVELTLIQYKRVGYHTWRRNQTMFSEEKLFIHLIVIANQKGYKKTKLIQENTL